MWMIKDWKKTTMEHTFDKSTDWQIFENPPAWGVYENKSGGDTVQFVISEGAPTDQTGSNLRGGEEKYAAVILNWNIYFKSEKAKVTIVSRSL